MSFRRLLNRTVTLIPRVASVDGRGNAVWSDGTPVEGVSTSRDPLELSEDAGDDRDQQTARFVFFFLPAAGPLALTGRDVIVDVDGRYEVIGQPDHVRRRLGGAVHHVEAIAERQA